MAQFTDYNIIEIGTYNEAVYMMEFAHEEFTKVLVTAYHDPNKESLFVVSHYIVDENDDVIDSINDYVFDSDIEAVDEARRLINSII